MIILWHAVSKSASYLAIPKSELHLHEAVRKGRDDRPFPRLGHLEIPYKVASQSCDREFDQNVENTNDSPPKAL